MGGEAGHQRREDRAADRGNTSGRTGWEELWGIDPEPDAPNYEDVMADSEAEAAARMEKIYGKIDTIEGMADDIPTFTEWMEQNDYAMNDPSGEYEGMQNLIDQLSAGPTEGDYDDAFGHAARLMGLSAEEAESMLGDLTRQMAEGVEGQDGMTEEEMALRKRENQSNLRMAEDRARRLVQDTFADSGSTAKMLQTADQATMQINNMQIQQDASLAQEDFERSLAQFQSMKASQQQMIETNQIGTAQYINSLQQGMGMALQGYAQKVSAMLQENQQYFQQYSADLDAMRTQIDTLYKAANLEIGATQAEMDLMESLYNQQVQPYLDELNTQMMEDELGFDWGEFLSGTVQFVAGIALMPVAPGAGIGLISSGGTTAAGAF